MSEFNFIKNKISGKWVVIAPKRAKKPDQAKGAVPPCPFCNTQNEEVVHRDGEVAVIKNKYPFAPIHEIVIHSKDHHKNLDELTKEQVVDVLRVYKNRFDTYKDQGQVYIFHNHGKEAGESLSHPHTQIAVIPNEVSLDILPLELDKEETKETESFRIFCPAGSQWPDEVWVAPKERGRAFGDAKEEEISDLSFILSRLIQIFDIRHGHEFPFNFYIYPGIDWYLRLVPRLKTIGGFELGTEVFVNTQDPKNTFEFIKNSFDNPDLDKIKSQHPADYNKGV